MSRPRVLHVVVAGEIGGAERLLVDLASRSAETRANHAVALFTPSGALAEMLRAGGLEVHDSAGGFAKARSPTSGALSARWMPRGSPA